MSGHSKWANIQHRKGRQDAKRSLGGLAVFQVSHERTADLQMLREQVAGLSGRARGIFGASFAQQRQKGMQFCARCAIIDAIMQ
mgnify:CR=1 FL=1